MFYTMKIKSSHNPKVAFESALSQARGMNVENILVFEQVSDEMVSEIATEGNEVRVRYCKQFSPEQLDLLKSNVHDVVVAHRWDRVCLEEHGVDIIYLVANRGTLIYHDYDSKASHKQRVIRNGVPLNQRRVIEPDLFTFDHANDEDGSMTFYEVGRPQNKVKLFLNGAPNNLDKWINVIEVKGRRQVAGFTLDERSKQILKAMLGDTNVPVRTPFFETNFPSFELVSLIQDGPYSAIGVVKDEKGEEYKFTCLSNGPIPVVYKDTMIDLRNFSGIYVDIREMQYKLHAALVESTRA